MLHDLLHDSCINVDRNASCYLFISFWIVSVLSTLETFPVRLGPWGIHGSAQEIVSALLLPCMLVSNGSLDCLNSRIPCKTVV